MTKTTFVAALVAALALPACDGTDDNLDSIDVAGLDSAGGKDDSLRHPTAAGELQLLYPETNQLERHSSGYHVYTFAGRAGWQVSFVEKSGAFRTYLRLYAPSGHRLSCSGVQNPDNGAWYSTLNLTLPETGTYHLLVTSYDNMRYYPYARSSGEYTVSADAELFCGGFGALQCPEYLKCMLAGSYPDAGGTCYRHDACREVSDCDGLIHPMCAIGPTGGWQCEDADRSGVGSCRYVCGGF